MMHLLVVDDYRDNAEAIAELLRGAPHVASVDVGFDGVQAVHLAAGHRPDVAILDIEMPRLSGVDAACAIKARMPAGGPLLIAMTGNADSALAAAASGVFDHVLQKPVDWPTLFRIVDAAWKHRPQPGAACAQFREQGHTAPAGRQ